MSQSSLFFFLFFFFFFNDTATTEIYTLSLHDALPISGATITPAVEVTAQDAHGNTATAFSGNVTVAIGTNAGGGALSGTSNVAAAGGIATFSGLSINKTGTGYTLTAGASGVGGGGGATSAAFSVTAGAPSVLVFSAQPTSATAGAAITPAVQVTAQDAQGNVATGFAGSVNVTIGSNAGGGTLSGTTTTAAVSGVVTFANLSINKVGTGYNLIAAASALTPVASAGFNITPGPAIALAFTVQPGDATAGAVIAPAVQGTAADAQGNGAPAFSRGVTGALGANPGGGTLGGTATVTAAGGVGTLRGPSGKQAGPRDTPAAAG